MALRSGGNSTALWGVCEDCPVLFSCNGQCRKNPLVYKFCQSPRTQTCWNTLCYSQHFQPTQCTQTHSHTHALPKTVNLEYDLCMFTLSHYCDLWHPELITTFLQKTCNHTFQVFVFFKVQLSKVPTTWNTTLFQPTQKFI